MASGPQLALDWEEGLFRGLVALWRRLAPRSERPERAEAATLREHAAAMGTTASVLAGEPLRLLPARGEGGLRAGDLVVPPALDGGGDAEANRELLLCRVAVGSTVRRLRLDRELPDGAGARALATLDRCRRATEVLAAELPRYAELHRRVAAAELAARPPGDPAWDSLRAAALDLDRPWDPPACPPAGPPGPALHLWGELLRVAVAAGEAAGDEGELAASSGTQRLGRPADEVERVELDEDKAREQVVMHSFEKIETLDEHRGQVQRTDGDDELDDHLEALDELDMRQVFRGGPRAESLLRAEVGIEAGVPDVADVYPGEKGVSYDEWDHKARRYKPGWCTVYPTAGGEGEAAWAAEALGRHRRLVDELHHRLLVHRTRRSPVRNQRDGEELDLDALVEDYAERAAGRGPSDRLYVRALRRSRRFATTVLLDVSLSSDTWIAERRVLDVAREAVLVLGEVTERLGDPLTVQSFASHTRNRCRVWTIRGEGEPWARGRARLGALRPQGYTRIGPALRHAAAELAAVDADRRLLLLVSDGKPTDYDRYEGRYGVADVRQAVREAEARGIVAHALAVDAVARDHLPPMFGPGAWHILPDPSRLPEVLTTVYGRLTGR